MEINGWKIQKVKRVKVESKNHTPAPWEYKPISDDFGGEVRSKDGIIARVWWVSHKPDKPVPSHENGLLIAAAPTMYKEILETMGRLDEIMKRTDKKIDDDTMMAIATMHQDLNRAAAIADGSWPGVTDNSNSETFECEIHQLEFLASQGFPKCLKK